eukprot:279364_1
MSSTSQIYTTLVNKYNNTTDETVQLYSNVLKINKRNKKQKRILLVTNKAIYNIKPKNKSIQRKIDLLQIASITSSSISTEFTLNVPSQYDYQYDALNSTTQNGIMSIICTQMNILQHTIIINKINNKTTSQWTVNKHVLKKINSAANITLRSMTALEHLENMGFKRNMARNTLNKNKGNLSLTIQALMTNFVEQSEKSNIVRSPFASDANAPISVKLSPTIKSKSKPNYKRTLSSPISSPMSISPSITHEIDELENMFDICQV